MSGLDADTVRHALQTARDRGFRVLKLQSGEMSLWAELSGERPCQEEVPQTSAPPPVAKEPETVDLTAPVVGYLREGAQPAAVGDLVKAGQPIFVVQALGIDNDAPAPASGEVVEICAKLGDPVEYGQTLARVRKNR